MTPMKLKYSPDLLRQYFPTKSHLCMMLILPAMLMAGCQKTVYMMPAPAAISTGDLDPFADTPEEERDSNIFLGYATNRKPVGAKNARFYTSEFDQDLRIGNAVVRIGDGKKNMG